MTTARPTPAVAPSLPALCRSAHYRRARRRVVRQLVESLLYEELVPVRWRPTAGALVAELPLREVAYDIRARRRPTFDRITLTAPVRRDGREPAPSRVLRDLARLLDADPHRLAAFCDELERTVLNDALARAHGDDTGGHPYHPSFRGRVGFDLRDTLAFAPECVPTVAPRWLALAPHLATTTSAAGVDPEAFLLRELGPDVLARFRAASPAGAHLLPVHPWQWREQLAHRLARHLAEGTVADLGAAPDRYRPRASIRTLANLDRPDRCDLKLALSITNTSTVRTLAPHTVANGPPVAGWLQAVVAGDPFLSPRTVVLGEVRGVAADAPAAPDLHGHLSCLWRQSLGPRLARGEQVVPFTALASHRGVVDPASRACLHRAGAGAWVDRLLEVCLVPLVHLLVVHGIALEAHAQNLLLLTRDGWPARLAVRDLHDGLRFCPHHLADPAAVPALTPSPPDHLAANRNSYIQAEDPTDVRDFLLDALLFVNLGQVALALADSGQLTEPAFWARARRAVLCHRRALPALAARHARFDVLAPTIAVEQLTARRLIPETQVRTHPVPNPLAREVPCARP